MKSYSKILSRIGWIVSSVTLMSCHSLKELSPGPDVILRGIKPTDNVAILLADGTEIRRMNVTAVFPDSIVGTYDEKNKPGEDAWKVKRTITIPTMEIKGIQNLKGGKRLYVAKSGSIVRITLKGGEVIKKFRISAINTESVVGFERITTPAAWKTNARLISLTEIAKIQLIVPEPGGSVLAVIGGLAVVILLASLIATGGGTHI